MLLRTTLRPKTKTPVSVSFSMLVLFLFLFLTKHLCELTGVGFLGGHFLSPYVIHVSDWIDAKTRYLPVCTGSFPPARINCRFSRPLAVLYSKLCKGVHLLGISDCMFAHHFGLIPHQNWSYIEEHYGPDTSSFTSGGNSVCAAMFALVSRKHRKILHYKDFFVFAFGPNTERWCVLKI